MTIQIKPKNDSLWQSIVLVLQFGGETKRVNFELRYLPETGYWYMSMFDVQSGEAYFRYVPVLSSSPDNPNNLWEPFWYKNIGVFLCLPAVDKPSTPDPSENNLNEFILVWGDGNG